MKKMLILLVAIMMGFCAQAANLEWSSYGALNDGAADEDWFTGGQAYLILVTDQANFAVANDLKITGGSIVDNGAYDVGAAGGAIDGSVFGAEDGSTYYFAVLATDKGEGSTLPTTGFYGIDNNGGSFYAVTWNKDTGGAFEANGDSFATVNNTIAGGSPLTPPDPSGIPEPTSGLLLLVGGALLALRRKQK